MATFGISASLNIDFLSPKSGSDTYNINGGYLTVDQDTRYGKNQSITASMGNIVMSATLGGTIEFNSQYVRVIPFTGGAGNVPFNTGSFIYQGTASGSLLGVYSGSGGLGLAPMTGSSQPMPPTGFIKIRQWNSQSFVINVPLSSSNGTFSATASAEDGPGWLEIVGCEAFTATVNRLNTFKVRGDWYTFQNVTSSGVAATTYQIPSNGSIVYAPGVWVETETATDLYEFYPCAGTATALLATIATDAIRGKVCWISTTGLLRFAHDGTNSTGGYLVPNGRRIRIPNIFFVNSTAAAKQTNALPNATLATRYDFTTTGAGVIDIDKASMCWYPSFNQPYSVGLTNTGIATQLLCTEIASPIAWNNVGVGQEAANGQFGLSLATCFAGGTITDCTWTSATLAGSGRYITTLTDCDGFLVTNEKLMAFAARGNATTGASTLTRVNNSTWKRQIQGLGRNLLTTCATLEYSGSIYYDHPALNTISGNPMYAFELFTNCNNILINALNFGGLKYVQPYAGILTIGSAGCKTTRLRNLGSYNAPLDLGGAETDVTWSRATTTATITSTAHGLATGDIIYVVISGDASAIAVGTKTITVTNANTFTFACTNAGAASGVLTYYLTMSGVLLNLAGGAAANTVKIQRCYTPHIRTNLISGDNSSKDIVLENVVGDYINAPLVPELNAQLKGIYSTPPLTAQTSCYGTLWFDTFISGIPETSSNASWVRTGTSVTISGSNHRMRTGLFINVISSSATDAIRQGQYTLTATASNLLVVTGLNASSASGTLTYVPYTGRVGIQMNEATSNSASITVESGSPVFTSAGTLAANSRNDQILFTTPEYIIGHTSFPPAEVTMAGGIFNDYDIKYALNTGSSYSGYRNLNIHRSGSWATASFTASVVSTAEIEVGDYVWGTNIYPNAQVVSILSTSSVSLNYRNLATATGSLRFNHLPAEGTIPDSGFKMKVRLKRVITGSLTAVSSLYWHTNSTTGSRALQYPLETNTLNIEIRDADGNFVTSPCEVTVVNSADTSILYSAEDVITGNTQYTYTYTGDINTYINVLNIDSYEPKTFSPVVLSNTDKTVSIQLDLERGKYSNP